MIKTALSASLIALAVLAPVASAAVETPPRAPKIPAVDPTAALCAEKAALTKANGAYTVKLTKEQMNLYASLDCPVEAPQPEPCPPVGKQEEWDAVLRGMMRRGAGGALPSWLRDVYRSECALEPLGDQRRAEMLAAGLAGTGQP